MNADNADEKAKKMQILQIEIGVWNADRPITLIKIERQKLRVLLKLRLINFHTNTHSQEQRSYWCYGVVYDAVTWPE